LDNLLSLHPALLEYAVVSRLVFISLSLLYPLKHHRLRTASAFVDGEYAQMKQMKQAKGVRGCGAYVGAKNETAQGSTTEFQFSARSSNALSTDPASFLSDDEEKNSFCVFGADGQLNDVHTIRMKVMEWNRLKEKDVAHRQSAHRRPIHRRCFADSLSNSASALGRTAHSVSKHSDEPRFVFALRCDALFCADVLAPKYLRSVHFFDDRRNVLRQ